MPAWLSRCADPLLVAMLPLSAAAGLFAVLTFLVLRLVDPELDAAFITTLWAALATVVQMLVIAGVVLHYWLPRFVAPVRPDGTHLQFGGLSAVAFLALPPVLVLGGTVVGQLVYGEPGEAPVEPLLLLVHASSLVVVLPTALHAMIERIRRGPAPPDPSDAHLPAQPSDSERRAFPIRRARPTAVVEKRRRPF